MQHLARAGMRLTELRQQHVASRGLLHLCVALLEWASLLLVALKLAPPQVSLVLVSLV